MCKPAERTSAELVEVASVVEAVAEFVAEAAVEATEQLS